MSDDKPMNIFQRVQKVMEAIGYVQKTKTVENYKAVEHDIVTGLIRDHFIKFGIAVVPTLMQAQMVDTGRKSKAGNPAFRYEGRFKIEFVNVDEPSDRIPIELDAHADDYGDKAPGKALSYAVKAAELKLLMLQSGEDEESRIQHEEEWNPLSEEELTGLKARLNAAKDKGALRKELKAVFEIAAKAKDAEAHRALKALGTELSKKLPEGPKEPV